MSYSGYLTKEGKNFKTWRHRFFVLQNDKISYYKKPEDTTPKGTIFIRGATILADPQNSKNGFHIKTKTRVFKILAKDAEDKEKWIKVIQAAIDTLPKQEEIAVEHHEEEDEEESESMYTLFIPIW